MTPYYIIKTKEIILPSKRWKDVTVQRSFLNHITLNVRTSVQFTDSIQNNWQFELFTNKWRETSNTEEEMWKLIRNYFILSSMTNLSICFSSVMIAEILYKYWKKYTKKKKVIPLLMKKRLNWNLSLRCKEIIGLMNQQEDMFTNWSTHFNFRQ